MMAKKKQRLLPRWLNGKLLFLLFFAVLVSHIVIFIIYSQKNSSAEFQVNRDVIARQVVNFIQTVQTTPEQSQGKIIGNLNLPNLRVTIDSKPKYNLRFENATLWQVLIKISEQQPNIQLSYMLAKHKWLNIVADIMPKSWGLQILLLLLELFIIAVILLFLWLINRFTVPLKKFTQAAERLGVDLHTDPLPVYGPQVVRATATSMNKMQQRIKDLIQARTQMLAAISHDLRTPITRLKLRSQYINDIPLQQKIVHDLDEMEVMISQTLAFAKNDSRKEKRVNVDIASLVASVCDDFAEMGHQVSYLGPRKGLKFSGGSVALRRMLSNIIDNAVKYAGMAKVDLQQFQQEIIIIIDDEGPGIPASQLKNIFAPFYRGESSRSRETGGVGLGLAVARDIAYAHGGGIELITREVNKGLRVKIIMPREGTDG